MDWYEKQKALINQQRPAEPPALPHNRPLWQDFSAYFKELFEFIAADEVYYQPQRLAEDMSANFGGNYNVEEVDRMLAMGCPLDPERGYLLKREDFIKPIRN